MKRLPLDRMVDRLLVKDEVDVDMIGRLSAGVAALHASAEINALITKAGGSETRSRDWRDNLAHLQPFIGHPPSARRLARIHACVSAFLSAESDLLAGREKKGKIRDCHGDMRTEAVCFDASVPHGICI